MSYPRFAAMILVSMLLMHGLTYLSTWDWAHVYPSQTRAWMTLIMGAGMTWVMLLAMWKMYPNRVANLAILGVAALVLAGAIAGLRSQVFVGDLAWMKAMIPHHSIAILTSTRARIEDPEAQALADRIIEAQTREIAEMKAMIDRLER